MSTMRIGSFEIQRVLEWVGPIKTVGEMFPDTADEAWTEDLAPHHWTPSTGAYRAAIQTWVLREGGRTILIDTGVGNDRARPQAPAFDHLDTDFLQRLARLGVDPAEVDVVVNTHIHYDHVGWNTRLDGTNWVPTFPNATYLVPQRDYDYFNPENAGSMRAARTEDEERRFAGARLVFADSITPIVEAGHLQTWDGEHRIDDALRLESAPGHTPGSSVAWLETGAGAVFVGDLMHTPVQIAHPDDPCAFDLDPEAASASRRQVLSAAARAGATVFPAHFAGHGAASVSAHDAANFRVDKWADFTAV
ncbi:MBL fold metallo-hydrolase [Cryobacterium sp. PH31-O1]|uniref:MBL fold metallo-hydrolase n=1 Tax=Cryobacterium sp. PH31-O1 TaxID=3046306 RepID=UPI0024BB8879|nr:MBL fold metallo-hydrolase [Cryobacterium sp. PH31-O1]MDJ0337305.1 MBL fold metallo-hydrolase [Cryobacterium sp. PH31-O1]